jgi:hypothetical protein
MPQLQQKQATNQIATLPGFKKMQLLDPNFLNQASSNPVVNNNGMQLTANVGNTPYYGVQQNNSNQMMAVNNTMPQGNNIIDYNHHTANSAPVKLANQMNAIYNQNKQNQTPQGSAYQQYQFQNNVSNPVVQQQPQMQLQPQSQQMVLPINNNQTQSTLTMPYGNNQNVQYSALNQNNNIQNLNPQYVVA